MINIIAAIQKKDRGLGYQNKLLFRLGEDLKNFKKLTLGNIVIMGRKTYDSIGCALPDRTNFIVTRNPNFNAPHNATVCHSLSEALSEAKILDKEIFIIGGGEIYKESLSKADRLYLTVVDGDQKADTFFPDYGVFGKTVSSEDRIDQKTNLAFQMLILEKT